MKRIKKWRKSQKNYKIYFKKRVLSWSLFLKKKYTSSKEHFIELKSNHELKVNNRECKILEGENQLRKKENIFIKEYRINNEFKKNLERKNEVLSQKLVKDESYLFLFRVSVFLMVMQQDFLLIFLKKFKLTWPIPINLKLLVLKKHDLWML